MRKLSSFISFVLLVGLIVRGVYAAEPTSENEARSEGSWWRIKVEVQHNNNFYRSGACEEMYPEYMIKIVGGTPVIYDIEGEGQQQIDCPAIQSQLLDSGTDKRGFLKFPMEIGMKPWPFTYLRSSSGGRSQWVTAESKMVAFGKIKLLIKEEELRAPRIEESAREILRKRVEELGKIGELDAFKIERHIDRELTETYYYAPEARAIILFQRRTARVERTNTVIDYHLE